MIVWAQRNVGLARTEGDPRPAARALFTALAPLVEAGRARGSIQRFFFQRKAPDVRLRFGVAAAGTSAEALGDIDAALVALVADGSLTTCFPSPYEPEVRKFGGPGAADACHRHFDAETSLWLAAQRLGTDDGPVLDPSPLDLAVTSADDLFVRVLQDRDEVWDAWANLVDLAGEPDPSAPAPARLSAEDAMASPLAEALTTMAGHHEVFASALHAELEAGDLRVGPRAILPFVAQLDLQRWGLGGPQQAAAATAMMSAWDPTTELRGR